MKEAFKYIKESSNMKPFHVNRVSEPNLIKELFQELLKGYSGFSV
jgi:hypothetical protein